jgi:hypothetical protein
VAEFEDFSKFKGFKHALVFFGGLDGIEGIIESDESCKMQCENLEKAFDFYLNTTS